MKAVLSELEAILRDARQLAADQARRWNRTLSLKIYLKQTNDLHNALKRRLSPFFKSQITAAQRNLRDMSPKSKDAATSADALIDMVFRPRDWDKALIDVAFPPLASSMVSAMHAQWITMGFGKPEKGKFGLTKSTASEWLEASGLTLPPGISAELPEWMIRSIRKHLMEAFTQSYWAKINDTTRGDIYVALETGLSEGWSIRKIADQINFLMPDAYDMKRATLVARTESANALNGARTAAMEEAAKELPETADLMHKAWLSVLADTTRDTHADLDGTLADVDGLFDVAGTKVPWPGHPALPPEQRCNCLCTVVTEFGRRENLV